MQFAIPALQAVATVGGTVSQVRAGNAAAKAGNIEATNERNAANYNANLEAGKHRQILGKQAVIAAGSGLDPSSGSLLDMALESSRQAAMDEEAIRFGGRARGETSRAQGRIAQRSLVNRGIGTTVAGSNTILSGLYSNYGGGSGVGMTSNSSWDVPEFRYRKEPLKFTISG